MPRGYAVMRCSALRHQVSDELRDNGRPLEWAPADSGGWIRAGHGQNRPWSQSCLTGFGKRRSLPRPSGLGLADLATDIAPQLHLAWDVAGMCNVHRQAPTTTADQRLGGLDLRGSLLLLVMVLLELALQAGG